MKKFFIVLTLTLVLAMILCGCLQWLEIPDEHYLGASAELINENASDNARELMRYLKSIYGKNTLAGQYINEYEDFTSPEFCSDPGDPTTSTVFLANELRAVNDVTGEYPAMIGLDVSGIECGERCFSIEQAMEWHDAGGIVTLCWHWKVDNLDGKPREFYTEKTAFDLSAALADKDGELYKSLIADIDAVSERLKVLADADVPVLWRPLHEASGGWFWWGAQGADAYKQLWDILLERMIGVHHLDNLIWVWNGQDPDWYVGDDKCDIVGDDPYYDFNEREEYLKDTANSLRFKKSYSAASTKMIMMSENDFIFDIDTAWESNTRWLSFCTWCREFVCVYEPDADGNMRTQPVYSEMCSTREELAAAYDNPKTMTLSRLIESGEYRPA